MALLSKLNLGCGKNYLPGWVNIDNQRMFPEAKVDINADINSLEYPANTIDHILFSHVAMYFRPERLKPLLVKFHGWLKLRGVLEIETADINKLANILLWELDQDKREKWGLMNLFGTPGTGPHEWGYTPDTLTKLLEETGFDPVWITCHNGDKKPERDFKLVCTKN